MIIFIILLSFIMANENEVVFKYPGKLDKVLNITTNQYRYQYGHIVQFKYQNGVRKTSFDKGFTWDIKKEVRNDEESVNFHINNEKIYFDKNVKSIKFFNLLGKKVLFYNNVSKEYSISKLSNEVYVVKLEIDNSFRTIKFIKN